LWISSLTEFWVGASDVGQQPGHFLWSDGRKVDGALFKSGEPSHFGSGKETCVRLVSSQGKLFDQPCSSMLYFVCKLAKKDHQCLWTNAAQCIKKQIISGIISGSLYNFFVKNSSWHFYNLINFWVQEVIFVLLNLK